MSSTMAMTSSMLIVPSSSRSSHPTCQPKGVLDIKGALRVVLKIECFDELVVCDLFVVFIERANKHLFVEGTHLKVDDAQHFP